MPHISPIIWMFLFFMLSILFYTQICRLGSYNPSCKK